MRGTHAWSSSRATPSSVVKSSSPMARLYSTIRLSCRALPPSVHAQGRAQYTHAPPHLEVIHGGIRWGELLMRRANDVVVYVAHGQQNRRWHSRPAAFGHAVTQGRATRAAANKRTQSHPKHTPSLKIEKRIHAKEDNRNRNSSSEQKTTRQELRTNVAAKNKDMSHVIGLNAFRSAQTRSSMR